MPVVVVVVAVATIRLNTRHCFLSYVECQRTCYHIGALAVHGGVAVGGREAARAGEDRLCGCVGAGGGGRLSWPRQLVS